MNAVVLLVVFATPTLTGAAIGLWSYWWPRHCLDRLFRERRAERVAANRLPTPVEPLPHLVVVNPAPTADEAFPDHLLRPVIGRRV